MKHFNAGADQSIVQGEHYQQTVTRAYKQNLSRVHINKKSYSN